MTQENCDGFSDELGVEPILVDCVAFTKSRRPRLFWLDWPVRARAAGGNEQMIYHDRFREWVFPDMKKD